MADWVRLSGFWKHQKNPKMMTGAVQGEAFDKLTDLVAEAQQSGKNKINLTLWLNEVNKPRDPKATLTAIVSDKEGSGERVDTKQSTGW